MFKQEMYFIIMKRYIVTDFTTCCCCCCWINKCLNKDHINNTTHQQNLVLLLHLKNDIYSQWKNISFQEFNFFIASAVTSGMTWMFRITLLYCFHFIASFNFILCHSTYGKTLCVLLFLLLPFKYSSNDPMNIK